MKTNPRVQAIGPAENNERDEERWDINIIYCSVMFIIIFLPPHITTISSATKHNSARITHSYHLTFAGWRRRVATYKVQQWQNYYYCYNYLPVVLFGVGPKWVFRRLKNVISKLHARSKYHNNSHVTSMYTHCKKLSNARTWDVYRLMWT